MPWAEGKHPVTQAYAWFLASWAKRLSWKEVAEERSAALRFICSDMWKPYLKIIAKKAGQAIVDDLREPMELVERYVLGQACGAKGIPLATRGEYVTNSM